MEARDILALISSPGESPNTTMALRFVNSLQYSVK
jgi:hypothetical protein